MGGGSGNPKVGWVLKYVSGGRSGNQVKNKSRLEEKKRDPKVPLVMIKLFLVVL